MDKIKFQNELSKIISNFPVLCTQINVIEGGNLSSGNLDTSMYKFDVLYAEQKIKNETINIWINFKNEDNPWVSVNLHQKPIGFSFYASEVPSTIVWDARVFPALKKTFRELNIEEDIIKLINDIHEVYEISK